MIISYSGSFVVHHLEKTGGTTVERSIWPHLKQYDLYLRDWQAFVFSPNRFINEHSGAVGSAEFLGDSWHRFKKFSTVRSPIEIMQSMYSFGRYIVDNTPREESLLYGVATAYEASHISHTGPDGFVDYMLSHDFFMIQPQSVRLGPMLGDGMIVDLSMLDDKWEDITDYLGFKNKVPMLRHRVLGSSDVKFSTDTEQKIKKWFRSDYEIFPEITGIEWR